MGVKWEKKRSVVSSRTEHPASQDILRRETSRIQHWERNHQGPGNALIEAEESVGSPHGNVHTHYVLVVIELSSRKVHIAGITPRPDGAFMMQVGRKLTDLQEGFVCGERLLILDRDQKFTTEFRNLLEHARTDVVQLPHRSPNLNAYVERSVLSIKSECLNRKIFFGEPSLRRAIVEFMHHYHGERNHQGLGNALLEAEECVGGPHGKVRCRRRLGGLLRYYHRAAA